MDMPFSCPEFLLTYLGVASVVIRTCTGEGSFPTGGLCQPPNSQCPMHCQRMDEWIDRWIDAVTGKFS